MKSIRLSLISLAALICATFLGSCDNENNGPAYTTFIDVVTYVDGSSTTSTFSYQTSEDSPLYLLTCNTGIASQVKQGERVVIVYYTPDNNPPSGNTQIELLQVGRVANFNIERTLEADTLKWRDNGLPVVSLWRTGKWLNMESLIPASTSSAPSYRLVFDETTAGDDIPTAYLMSTTTFNPSFTETNNYFSSFDIEPLLDYVRTNGLRIRFSNPLGDKETEVLLKDKKD